MGTLNQEAARSAAAAPLFLRPMTPGRSYQRFYANLGHFSFLFHMGKRQNSAGREANSRIDKLRRRFFSFFPAVDGWTNHNNVH